MGCDIHCFVEHKVDNSWYCNNYSSENGIASEIFIPRNYDLFGFLAGVRKERYDSLPLLGLPSDIADGTHDFYKKYWADDAHSESFIYLNEIKQYIMEFALIPEKEGYYVLNGLNHILNLFNTSDKNNHHSPENSRIIFWFDN
jgi:hypothetical protein